MNPQKVIFGSVLVFVLEMAHFQAPLQTLMKPIENHKRIVKFGFYDF
jgi:hypothetical protein